MLFDEISRYDGHKYLGYFFFYLITNYFICISFDTIVIVPTLI